MFESNTLKRRFEGMCPSVRRTFFLLKRPQNLFRRALVDVCLHVNVYIYVQTCQKENRQIMIAHLILNPVQIFDKQPSNGSEEAERGRPGRVSYVFFSLNILSKNRKGELCVFFNIDQKGEG